MNYSTNNEMMNNNKHMVNNDLTEIDNSTRPPMNQNRLNLLMKSHKRFAKKI